MNKIIQVDLDGFEGNCGIEVYRVTSSTETLPLLNNREFSADSYDWEEFERRANEKLLHQPVSQLHEDSFKLN